MIEATKLIGTAVAAVDSQSRIGEIREIFIDPNNGKIMGFLVKMDGLLGPTRALSFMDIKDWDPNGIVTETEENLVEPSEIVRIKKLIEKNIILLGMKAETESGKSLGKVENFLIDTQTETVVKYYLNDLILGQKIIPADKVIQIDHKIIFADEVIEGSSGAVSTQLA